MEILTKITQFIQGLTYRKSLHLLSLHRIDYSVRNADHQKLSLEGQEEKQGKQYRIPVAKEATNI